jgi:hypothetical protein
LQLPILHRIPNLVIPGGFIQWETPVLFLHMVTQLYMTVKLDGKVRLELTDNRDDPSTVFRLHPVIRVHNLSAINSILI